MAKEPGVEMGEDAPRFGFGQNWQDFVDKHLSEERIEIAQRHLLRFLQLPDLRGRSFLDIGSGSGLHSLAALRAGADRIVSFDCDRDSVATTERLKELSGSPAHWQVLEGDVLDRAFVEKLEPADVVYSWGVLHHTGDIWRAIENSATRVAPGGVFYVALYTYDVQIDPTPEFWLEVKQRYNRASELGRRWMELWYVCRFTLLPHLRHGRNPLGAIRGQKFSRGMSYYTDVKDWLGGWPMEFAKIADVKRFADESLEMEVSSLWGGEANTEYLLRPRGVPNYWDDVLERHPEVPLTGPFERGEGHAWWACLPSLLACPLDAAAAPGASTLQLYEDGQPLGLAHAPRGDIGSIGGGRYSHRDGRLLFSTCDNSDPNRNARGYTVRVGLR